MITTLRRVVVAACILLSGWAGAQAQTAAKGNPPAGQKTIGLIAAMGDALAVVTYGTNSFADEERRFSIESWKVSDRVAAAVSAKLGKSFTVKRIPAPAGAFAVLGNPGFFAPDFDENYRRLVRAIAADHKADLYLAISPGYSRIGQGDQIARGLGVVRSETLLTRQDVVHALVLYRLFDAEFKPLRSAGAMLGRAPVIEIIVGPHLRLEDGKRLPRDARLTASAERTRELALGLLDNDLAATLPTLIGLK